MIRAVFFLGLLPLLLPVSQGRAGELPPLIANEVRSYPHDPRAMTQGLAFHDGRLVESTGGFNNSSVRLVDLTSGKVLLQRGLPKGIFGEGVALHDGVFYQLTWRSGRVFLYDPVTLEPRGEKQIGRVAWGLTSDGERLVVSDGSSILRFLDPETFKETGILEVHDSKGAVSGLNELEMVQGRLWANLYPTSEIAVIDAKTGEVIRRLDLGSLARTMKGRSRGGVANGIAFDADTGRIWATGKHWPRIFEIEAAR